jgi:hypothetical protein
MNLFRSSPLCQVPQGEEFVRPPPEGAGGESEGLIELNLTETLIYLVAISLEINFLTASLRKTSEFDFYNQTQVYFYEILALQQGVFIFDE